MLERSQSTAHVGSWEVTIGGHRRHAGGRGALVGRDVPHARVRARLLPCHLRELLRVHPPGGSRTGARRRREQGPARRAGRERISHRPARWDRAAHAHLDRLRARRRRQTDPHDRHLPGRHRAQARRAGAARGRPPQGRVPGDAVARAAQSAGADPQRDRDHRARRAGGPGAAIGVSRGHRAAGPAHEAAARRPAGRLARQPGQDRAPQAAGGAGDAAAAGRRGQPAADGREAAAARADAGAAAAAAGGRPDAHRPGVREPAQQRRQVHERGRPHHAHLHGRGRRGGRQGSRRRARA